MFFHRVRQIYWFLCFLITKPFYKNVGRWSYLAKPLSIIGYRNIIIGNRTRVMPGIRIEAHGEHCEVLVGDNVSIGPSCSIISGAGYHVEICDDVTISGNVFVCSYEHQYQEIGVHIMDQQCSGSSTHIGGGCFIGYGSVLLAGTKLGKQCVVGANSVVRGEFPDYCVIAGSPAKIIKKYSFETSEWENFNE
ncbi:MAG: acyltransferase [Neptuniibacter sp.]